MGVDVWHCVLPELLLCVSEGCSDGVRVGATVRQLCGPWTVHDGDYTGVEHKRRLLEGNRFGWRANDAVGA